MLELGLHFRRSPSKILVLQLIAGAEMVARELEKRNRIAANTFQIYCSNTIQRAQAPHSNLPYQQRQALMQLCNNQALVILTADKGGKVVVLDAIAYTTLCIEHLSDPAYERVTSFGTGTNKVLLRDENDNSLLQFQDTDFEILDPSDKLLRLQCGRLTNLLSSLQSTDQISSEDRKKCLPGQPFSGVVPHFYALPKVHKIGRLRIRPIVSNVDIYCDKLLIHLKSVLNLVFRSVILNSYDFVSWVDQLELEDNDRLVSFDVESLYTNVPVEETLLIVETRLQALRSTDQGREKYEETTSLSVDAFMSLLHLMVKDFYFSWHGQLFRQKKGLPMGSRLSPVLANVFMEELETVVLSGLLIQPKLYCRFVDDIFIVYNSETCPSEDLLALFNEQHADIHLTCEHEEAGRLAFLDLLLNCSQHPALLQPRKLSLDLFRKATHCHRFLHYNSATPLATKRNTFRGQWLKGQWLLRNHPEGLDREMRYLRRTFQNRRNRYPQFQIRAWLE